MAHVHGIRLKKEFGQHFLREQRYVDSMISAVQITNNTSVFEVGPGDGFLTHAILATRVARLWSFEIDDDWATHLTSTITDARFKLVHQNFLDIDFSMFAEHQPWTVLANLPYLITFPILHKLQEHRHLLKEGVIMVQEEVAQKLLKTSGKGYGYPSLFFQRFFEWRLLDKVPPSAFIPPPKIFSRLLYFKTKAHVPAIKDESRFWEFIKVCFKQPRRTLLNNLKQSHYDADRVPADVLKLRAQQMNIDQLVDLWNVLNTTV